MNQYPVDGLEKYTERLDNIHNKLSNPPKTNDILNFVCKRDYHEDFIVLASMGKGGAEGSIEKVKERFTGQIFAAKVLNENNPIIQKKLCVGKDASIYI